MIKIQTNSILCRYQKPVIEKIAGYIHPDGAISFVDKNSAMNYAKKRVVSALNYENGKKPFERAILIHDNTILCETNGGRSRVSLDVPKQYRHLEYISVHGHPDASDNLLEETVRKVKNYILGFFNKHESPTIRQSTGITYPISIPDYMCLMSNPNETEAIVYNAKGQYSKLTKLPDADSIGYNELKSIDIESEIYFPKGYFYQIKEALKSIMRAFYSPQKAEKLALKDINIRQKQKHNFWIENDQNLCKVKYKTDFFGKPF